MNPMNAFIALRLALLLAAVPALPAAAAGTADPDAARLSRAAYRCTRLAELISCYDALNLSPNDAGLLVAEADALVQLNRPGEAVGVYRHALSVGAAAEVVGPKIDLAQALRQSLLETCLTHENEAGERACAAAWLPGAPDEVTVFKRRGVLLQAAGQPAAALDAYLTAARFRPKDRGVAQAIVSLSDTVGREDASTLTAVGTALIALGRRDDAVAALREALRLEPGLAAARERLRTVERPAATHVARPAPPAGLPPAAAGDAADTPSGDAAPGNPYSNAAEPTRSN